MIRRFILLVLCAGLASAGQRPFVIRVVDGETGRGVPLVELETTAKVSYWTDSSGLIAYDEPGLMGRETWFAIRSHGYEAAADGFGMRGVRLTPLAGAEATVRVRRAQLAERLYRFTGEGIYRDTLLAGRRAPVRDAAIASQVTGLDSGQAVPYRGRLFWIFGDTDRLAYPLGNFFATAATSSLADDPDRGLELSYFEGPDGFCKKAAPMEPGGMPVWLGALMTARDGSGRERLLARYQRPDAQLRPVERGLVLWDDDARQFRKLTRFPATVPFEHEGYATSVALRHEGFVYFASPYPNARVRDRWSDIVNPASYECWTPAGWKRGARAIAPSGHPQFALRDAASGKPVLAKAGSVSWNAHRRRWVMIAQEAGGTSPLGEIWYSESKELAGPWRRAVKLATHDRYSFYNPSQLPFFDRDGGRTLYFQATYTHLFSGNTEQTPRYDYNQILCRLDVDRAAAALQ